MQEWKSCESVEVINLVIHCRRMVFSILIYSWPRHRFTENDIFLTPPISRGLISGTCLSPFPEQTSLYNPCKTVKNLKEDVGWNFDTFSICKLTFTKKKKLTSEQVRWNPDRMIGIWMVTTAESAFEIVDQVSRSDNI